MRRIQPLTPAQARLVSAHADLPAKVVGVFLRRSSVAEQAYWDDLVQEAFLGMMVATQTWDETRGTYRDHAYNHAKAFVWAYARTRTRAITTPRQGAPVLERVNMEDLDDAHHDPTPAVEARITCRSIAAELERLAAREGPGGRAWVEAYAENRVGHSDYSHGQRTEGETWTSAALGKRHHVKPVTVQRKLAVVDAQVKEWLGDEVAA